MTRGKGKRKRGGRKLGITWYPIKKRGVEETEHD